MKKEFRFVTANVKPIVRNDQMEGRDWVVAPMIEITEGVHNGSDGPIFYSADELSKGLATWNHRPVVVYHPKGGSACDPVELTSRKIGVTMATNFDKDKVKAEAWLDPDRVEKIDNRIAEAIENNETMELSTGLFMELERTKGAWENSEGIKEQYIGIAKNLSLDHLAILPDLKGACSIKDGAGFLRNAMNEVSHDATRMLLGSSLREKLEDAWIQDVYDKFIIFEDDGKLFHQSYTEANGIVSLTGDINEVTREIKYKKVLDGTVINKCGGCKNRKEKIVNKLKGKDMDKKKIVDALISNEKTSWKEENREMLMKLEDDVLTNMLAPIVALETANAELQTKIEANDKKEEKKVEKTVDNKQGEQKTPQTAEEYIAAAPKDVQEILNSASDSLKREKERLIETITANEQNTFKKEELLERSVTELIALAKLAAPIGNEQKPEPLYIGQRPLANQDNDAPTEGLPLPVMNCGEEKKT